MLTVVAACGADPPDGAPSTTSSTSMTPAVTDIASSIAATSTVTTTTSAPTTSAPTTIASTTTAPPPVTTGARPTPTLAGDAPSDLALREELLAMLEADQAVRTGIAPPGDDRTPDELFAAMDEVDDHNQRRLREIFDEHGWPGWSLVGRDGSTAAWAVVQHADLDLAFQQLGWDLLKAAVDAGDASPGELAYLTDRILVATGEEQEYGTQWSSDEDGNPVPRTPIRDAANVDARRAAAGLSTLEEYLAELEAAFGSAGG